MPKSVLHNGEGLQMSADEVRHSSTFPKLLQTPVQLLDRTFHCLASQSHPREGRALELPKKELPKAPPSRPMFLPPPESSFPSSKYVFEPTVFTFTHSQMSSHSSSQTGTPAWGSLLNSLPWRQQMATRPDNHTPPPAVYITASSGGGDLTTLGTDPTTESWFYSRGQVQVYCDQLQVAAK